MNPIKSLLLQELQNAGWHSRGYLPHFDGGEIAQTITFRVADSLPQKVLAKWKRELANSDKTDSVLRKRIESYLDQGYGTCALRDVRVAKIVQDSLLHFDGERYRLSAWVVMPNHVHLLLTPCIAWSVSRIMKDIKSFTSHKANTILERSGQFWMEDYFDRYVRDNRHFASSVVYIENNPVRARLCVKADDWPFSSASFRTRT